MDTAGEASPLDAPDAAAPMKQLRATRATGQNIMLEQLDTVLAFAATQEEQIQAAFEIIYAHGQSDDWPKRLPSWLESALL